MSKEDEQLEEITQEEKPAEEEPAEEVEQEETTAEETPAENAPEEEAEPAQPEEVKKPHESKKAEKKEAELAKAVAAAEDYKRKWYAVAAEYDNYRKRTQSQAAIAYQEGKAEAILKLLPVADTFGYAYDGATDEKTKAGIDKIVKNFNNILLSLGVEEVPVNVGDKFDESVMEAVMNLPAEEGEEPNTVKVVLKKGYRREGKVIRFAQVSVTV